MCALALLMELGPYKDKGKLSHSMTSYELIEHFKMALATRSNIAKAELCRYSASYFSCADLHKQVSQFSGSQFTTSSRHNSPNKVFIFPLTLALTFILIQNEGQPNYG